MFDPEKVTYFAETDSRNRRVRFGIKAKDRSRHIYVIGKTGMGKSTLLENLAIQDILNGNGLAVIDPHGSFAEALLDFVPEHRINDVLYFAPFDMEYPISFNVMEDVGPDKRHLVANGLMSAFKKIWVDAWSARMEYILGNILLALLEYPDSTLVGVNRMLADKEYRDKVIDNITDPSVKAFWLDEFNKYGERYMQEAGAAIQNKIGQFVSNPIIRNIIGQPRSSFDIRAIMDTNKIMIVNLSKGRVGEANANLLGGMLVTKIYLAAMSRADLSPELMKAAPNFYLFVDEFQSFANESFADILSEARKYKLNLTIAHQYVEQMPEEVRSAVFGNVGTMITFRIGAFDSEIFEKEYAPQFAAQDLVNLGFAQIYLKLMIDGVSSQPFSAATMAPWKKPDTIYRDIIIERSREQFAATRAAVEESIRKWHEDGRSADKPKAGKGGGNGGGNSGGGGGAGGGNRPGGPSGQGVRRTGGQGDNRPQSSFQPRREQPRYDQPQRGPSQPHNEQPQREQPQRQDVRRDEVRREQTQRDVPRPAQQPAPQQPARIDAPQSEVRTDVPRPVSTIPASRPAPAPSALMPKVNERRVAEQAEREKQLRSAVSLSMLKPAAEREREQKKVMTEENAATLRDALGSVLGQLGIATEPTPKPVAPRPVAPMPVTPVSVASTPTPTPVAPKPVVTQAAQAPIQHEVTQEKRQEKPYEPTREVKNEFQEVPREVLEAALRVDDVPPTA
jgi:uncharacterized membrane protein YgcG